MVTTVVTAITVVETPIGTSKLALIAVRALYQGPRTPWHHRTVDLGPGDLLSDNLKLERCLGSGGMGSVWTAKNLALESRVAVKLLHRLGPKEAERQRARFEQEAKIVAKLDHPHIVKVFDFGMTADGDPFIVMELLSGEDLASRLKRLGRLPVASTVAIVEQAASALGRAHARGVIHRDIKPGNIFLVDVPNDPFVKIVDFGLAKLVTTSASLTRSGEILGTPFYMSPEQFLRPKDIDDRTDLWALGVVTYACLTGSLPFAGDTIAGVAMAVTEGRFASPSARDASLPPALDAFMQRALATDSKGRFQTAAELSSALRDAAESPRPHLSTATPKPAAPAASAPAPIAPPALADTRPVERPPSAALAPPAPSPSTSPAPKPVWPWAVGSAALAALAAGGAVFFATRTTSGPPSGSASERPTPNETIDLSKASVRDLVARTTKAAKEKDSAATLLALSIWDLEASSVVASTGRVKSTFSISGGRCLDVTITAAGLARSEPSPCGSMKGRDPRCSVEQIRARIPSKQSVKLIFASLPNGGGVWTYSASEGGGGNLPDDCP